MAVDPLSPIAPARIRALLLPVGRIKRSRFLAFVELLQQQSLVRLGDVSPDSRPDRNMFSPLAFPRGTLMYDLSTSFPPASHLSLSPFEQYREPLLVIGVGDASEYEWLAPSHASDGSSNGEIRSEEGAEVVQAAVEDMREQFPRAYLHSLMMFGYEAQSRHPRLPPDTFMIPPISQLKTTTMKTFMCDLTAKLLAEMTTLARSIQALPTVLSPASLSGAAGSTPSWATSEFTSTPFSRRESQTPSASRPESPVSGAQKDVQRASMPVLPSTSGGPLLTDDPRSASPTAKGARTPPTTFDEISGANTVNISHQPHSGTAKAIVSNKEPASDRVSIQGFGSGGVGERARNKGRGRIGIVIGTLYMCAGHWHEAVKELTEGAITARALSDHLWHAKALEHIMVCLLLFAWSGIDFNIPRVCYPIFDKTAGTTSPQHTPSNSVADISAAATASQHEAALESLNALLPDMINMILNLYTRAANFAGESLPPLAFSECVIRFSKLLAAMNLSAGYIDIDTLQHIVQNTPYRQRPRLSVPRLSVHPTRNDIASMLFRALPGPPETSGIHPTDRVVVLAGITTVLSSLGLQRKKAMMMRDFITSLVPGLVQARKVGAAEMGVHPAAGLASLNIASGGALTLSEGEVETGISEFLGLIGRIYGIPISKDAAQQTDIPASATTLTASRSDHQTSQGVIEDIMKVSSLRAFGSVGVKLEVIRMCLAFCEALPDLNGIVHFTALLLRMAGPGTAPRPNSTDVFVSLPRDEQVRLFSNISRTMATASKLGLRLEETYYWDDFLVRGLFILEEPTPLRLTHHRSVELKATTGKDGPFLHNPWMKKPQSSVANPILVANEEYRFIIALQNPYDFELEVDSLRIATEGVEFVAIETHFFLGPYRTQKFQIAGVARGAGVMKIIGCHIKVVGCQEQLFPIFPDPWKPTREFKIKRIGLKACLGAPASRPSSAVAPLTKASPGSEPRPETLTFSVIPEQPVAVITGTSLPQSSLMILEGERKRFTITLQNTSKTTSIDFVHITFQDTATSAIQAATSNKDLPAAELHELEVQLAHYPALRWCEVAGDESFCIQPGRKMDFTIEVVGRTRLQDAIIQVDYANLGKRRSEVEDRFFTRQVAVALSITVNASVQLHRPDIVPLSNDFVWSKQSGSKTPSVHDKSGTSDCCMLLLDLRNAWPYPLSITLSYGCAETSNFDRHALGESHTIDEVIQPGHVSRIAMVVPKLYLKDKHDAIPSLNPANQRQFVISVSKISPETEQASREAFWYRDAFLKLLHGTWREEGNGRHGDLEIRSIRFTPRMVEAIKLEDLKVEMSIASDFSSTEDAGNIRQLGRSRFDVPADAFLTLRTTVHNRSSRSISPLLRLQPYMANLPHNIALDLDKRFSWTGALQQNLPVIHPGGECLHEIGIVALCSGVFEIGATVDEVELPNAVGEDGNRSRSDTAILLQGDMLGESKLRTWYMKEPCIIVARTCGG